MERRASGQGYSALHASLGFVLLAGALITSAADKSGVGPNTISVPKGPGSIEGLGESFQPTLNTGIAKYSVALKVPPGTAGHHPDLKLVYEGGGGNGPLGFGWQLPMQLVQRRTDEGIPTYGEDVGFFRADTFINDMKEELVPLTNGFYFSKNEGTFIRYTQVSNHWEGTLPDGTRLQFGLTDSARIQETNNAHVFAWLLEKETDTHGNTIVYSYSAFPDDQNRNQKYLTGITYGPGAPPWASFHFVTFVYEDRPDWFEDCRSGFVVRTGKRLKRKIIGTQGPTLAGHLQGDFNNDGAPDNLVRIYELDYLKYASTNSFWSLLASVQTIGADGTNALPASTFGYSVCNPPDRLSAAGQIITDVNEPTWVMDNQLVDLVDLNGDGLPDILKAGGRAWLCLSRTLRPRRPSAARMSRQPTWISTNASISSGAYPQGPGLTTRSGSTSATSNTPRALPCPGQRSHVLLAGCPNCRLQRRPRSGHPAVASDRPDRHGGPGLRPFL
jgi:hypothetical protein